MTFDEVRQLEIGIYRILWKEGGSSIAAVGVTESGGRWMAPLNWVSPTVNQNTWEEVEAAVLLLKRTWSVAGSVAEKPSTDNPPHPNAE